jgi:hypothetical protein
MKIKCDLRAGATFGECDAQRNYMKQAAQRGDCSALNRYYPSTNYPSQLPSQPPAYRPPVYTPPSQLPTQGGGYHGGVYYPDRSGSCG